MRKVVGVQFSIGDRFAITEYIDAGPHGIDLVLDGSNLVMGIDSRIELFDLNTRMNTRTIDVPNGHGHLSDVHGDWALESRTDSDVGTVFCLINLSDGTQTQLPPAPGDTQPHAAWLAESWAVFRRGGFEAEPFELLTFHIPSQEWRVLASNDPADTVEFCWPWTDSCFDGEIEFRYVTGLNETHAILFREYLGKPLELPFSDFSDPPFSEIELVDLITGERTLVAREFSDFEIFDPLSRPFLAEDRLYWIDNMTRTLMIYDIAAGTYRDLPLPSTSGVEGKS